MVGDIKFIQGLRGKVDAPRVIEASWEGDAGDGSIPETNTPDLHGKVNRIVTVPGTGSEVPTSYGLALLDVDGVDILNGNGVGRSATGRGHILFDNPVAVNGPLTICITGQTNVGATGKIVIYMDRDQI